MTTTNVTAAGAPAAERITPKIALVTGAGSGIGAACAAALSRGGAQVVLADMNFNSAERVADAIRAAAGAATAVRADVTEPASAQAMVACAMDTYGGLDWAVNNAGIGGHDLPTGEYPIGGWQHVLDVNLTGVFYCMRAELPAMVKRGGGAIVNIASMLGSVACANSCAYIAAKHGVVGLTRGAALEYATRGIRINSVGTGFIETPLIDRASLERQHELAERHPIKRCGTSEEVAALVSFLLSEAASFCTGVYYPTDGGVFLDSARAH